MSAAVQFAKYYSSRAEGGLATRFGTGTYIGANRSHEDPKQVVFDETAVVGITVLEYARYRKEYEKAVKGGSLVERTANDLAAYLKSLEAPKPAETTDPEATSDDKPKRARKSSE